MTFECNNAVLKISKIHQKKTVSNLDEIPVFCIRCHGGILPPKYDHYIRDLCHFYFTANPVIHTLPLLEIFSSS